MVGEVVVCAEDEDAGEELDWEGVDACFLRAMRRDWRQAVMGAHLDHDGRRQGWKIPLGPPIAQPSVLHVMRDGGGDLPWVRVTKPSTNVGRE